MMAFHRRSKRVKTFSETFVTMYLYKRDSNTSKRAFILLHNYLKEKTRKKKTLFELVNIGYPCLKFNVFMPFDGCLNYETHHCTCSKFVFVGLGRRRLADVAQKSRLLGNSTLYIVSKQNDSSK